MTRTPAWARTWSFLRVAMAALIGAAIVRQLVESVSQAVTLERNVAVVVVNFFSFFTILSNVLSVIVLVWAAVWFWRTGRSVASPEPRFLATVLACTTTYMIVTGIVYNTLLRGIELPQGAAPVPWSNEVLHVVAPLFLLADLFLGPRRRALPWRAALEVLVFPIAWVVYTLVRGPLTTNPTTGDPFWYPYPFLNPNNFDNGYGTVAIYIVGISVVIVLAATLVVWVGRRRGTDAAAADPATTASPAPAA